MANFIDFLTSAQERIVGFFNGVLSDTWRWFTLLNREEWIVVLAIGASCGFLCMRGFGSRSKF
jgi:hypothetical protein